MTAEMRQRGAAVDHAAGNRALATALMYVAPNQAELRPIPTRDATISAALPCLLIEALHSCISRGTERLVYEGRLPPSEWQRMRCPQQHGAFPHPVAYGYQWVGRVVAGPPEWVGAVVFTLAPHRDRIELPATAVARVPAAVPPRRATLAANMETALNALWDGGALPCQRIAVVGGGVVGCLVARLCARLPGAAVTLVDIDPARAAIAAALGARFTAPEDATGEADLVFHASGHAAGLTTALRLAGTEATLVELSWYGDRHIALPLGEAFHSRRLRLVSSQVGAVAPAMRPRWTHGERLAAALRLLDDPVLDTLLGDDIAFADLPRRLPDVFSGRYAAPAAIVAY